MCCVCAYVHVHVCVRVLFFSVSMRVSFLSLCVYVREYVCASLSLSHCLCLCLSLHVCVFMYGWMCVCVRVCARARDHARLHVCGFAPDEAENERSLAHSPLDSLPAPTYMRIQTPLLALPTVRALLSPFRPVLPRDIYKCECE